MNKIVLLFVSLLFATNEQYHRENLIENAQEQANIMGRAFLKEDYKTFAQYTYPALLISMGGETIMAITLRKMVGDMRVKGMSFSSITVDTPSKLVKSRNELQCTLQQHTTIKVQNGRVIATSTLIAI